MYDSQRYNDDHPILTPFPLKTSKVPLSLLRLCQSQAIFPQLTSYSTVLAALLLLGFSGGFSSGLPLLSKQFLRAGLFPQSMALNSLQGQKQKTAQKVQQTKLKTESAQVNFCMLEQAARLSWFWMGVRKKTMKLMEKKMLMKMKTIITWQLSWCCIMQRRKKKKMPKMAYRRKEFAATKFRITTRAWITSRTRMAVRQEAAFSVAGATGGPRHILYIITGLNERLFQDYIRGIGERGLVFGTGGEIGSDGSKLGVLRFVAMSFFSFG